MSQQLDDPFICYTAGTDTRRVRRTEIINPKIRNPRLAACGAPNPLNGLVMLSRVNMATWIPEPMSSVTVSLDSGQFLRSTSVAGR